MREGDKGDMFYMIEEGAVDVTRASLSNNLICRLRKGDIFREKTLLFDDIRSTTYIAVSRLKYLVLVCKNFVWMLDNLTEIIDT